MTGFEYCAAAFYRCPGQIFLKQRHIMGHLHSKYRCCRDAGAERELTVKASGNRKTAAETEEFQFVRK